MTKFLDVGSSDVTRAGMFDTYGELEVTRLDADPETWPDVVHNMMDPLPPEHQGKYDIVLASHMLEHIEYRYVNQVMRNIVEAVKIGGEVWVFVPSMEWCAREILIGRDGIGLQGTVFGGEMNPWDYHKTGFTLPLLAATLKAAGCKDVQGGGTRIDIVVLGETYPSYQNNAKGIRER
jgi:hypothetical protein